MQEGKGHRKYDRQFKEEAVRLVTEGQRPVTEVARADLGYMRTCCTHGNVSIKKTPHGVFRVKGT